MALLRLPSRVSTRLPIPRRWSDFCVSLPCDSRPRARAPRASSQVGTVDAAPPWPRSGAFASVARDGMTIFSRVSAASGSEWSFSKDPPPDRRESGGVREWFSTWDPGGSQAGSCRCGRSGVLRPDRRSRRPDRLADRLRRTLLSTRAQSSAPERHERPEAGRRGERRRSVRRLFALRDHPAFGSFERACLARLVVVSVFDRDADRLRG